MSKLNINYMVHESSVIDEGAEIGSKTQIWHFCHIMKDARIGHDCNIGQNVFVSSGVSIGNYVKIQNNVSLYEGIVLEDAVFCGPSCVFTNVMNPRSEVSRKKEYKQTLVKYGATIGANATIVCGVTIGKHAFIGAGSVVTKDVPDHALVYGNPSQIKGWMSAAGEKLDFVNGVAMCSRTNIKYVKNDDCVAEEE